MTLFILLEKELSCGCSLMQSLVSWVWTNVKGVIWTKSKRTSHHGLLTCKVLNQELELYLEFLHVLMRGMLQGDKKTRMESRHSGSATCRSPRPAVIERHYLPVTRAGFLSLPTRRWCCYHCSNDFPREILQDEGTLFSPGNSFCGECRDCYIQPAIAVELHL